MRIEVFSDIEVLRDAAATLDRVCQPIGMASVAEEFLSHPVLAETTRDRAKRYCVVPLYLGFGDEDSSWPPDVRRRFPQFLRAADRALRRELERIRGLAPRDATLVCFQFGDRIETYPALGSGIVFKNSARRRRRNELGVPYYVPSPERITPISRAKYLMSFQGSSWGLQVRQDLVKILPSLRDKPRPTWLRYTDCEPMGPSADRAYEQLLDDSVFVLAPRGIGLSSIRFFEALARGRIPILISDEVRLPLERVVPYEKFVVRVPERRIHRTWEIVKESLRGADLNERSRLARAAYDRYLRRPLPELVRTSLLALGSR